MIVTRALTCSTAAVYIDGHSLQSCCVPVREMSSDLCRVTRLVASRIFNQSQIAVHLYRLFNDVISFCGFFKKLGHIPLPVYPSHFQEWLRHADFKLKQGICYPSKS